MTGKGLDFVLMGTDYSRPFLDKVAQCLDGRGLDFSLGNITTDSFPGGHRFVQLDENVRGNVLWVLHSYLLGRPVLSDMDLFMIADAAKRSSCESFTVATTFTDFRGDKKSDGRVPIYAKMFADFLQKAGGNKLGRFGTAHPHSDQVQGFFDISFDSLPTIDVVEWYCTNVLFSHLGIDDPSSQVLVYSGDGGSVSVNWRLAGRFGTQSLSLDKLRTIKSAGNESTTDGPSNGNLIYDKVVLTLDDIFDSGGTGCELAESCLALGAKSFYEFATHGLMSKKKGVRAEDRVRSVKKMYVITTDTAPRSAEYLEENRDWLVGYISLAPIYAELIYRTVMHESVSAMFRDPTEKGFDPRLKEQLMDTFNRFYGKPEFFTNQLPVIGQVPIIAAGDGTGTDYAGEGKS